MYCGHGEVTDQSCPTCGISTLSDRLGELEREVCLLVQERNLLAERAESAGNFFQVFYQKGWEDCLRQCQETLKKNNIDLVL